MTYCYNQSLVDLSSLILRIFFLQQMLIKIETYNWLNCREYETTEISAVSGTSISHTLCSESWELLRKKRKNVIRVNGEA